MYSTTKPPLSQVHQERENQGAADVPEGVRPGRSASPGFINRFITNQSRKMEVYKCDVIVRRSSYEIGIRRPVKRGKVKKFSRPSARRLSFTVRNTIDFETLVTLTYPGEYPCDGRLVKYHLKMISKWLMRQGCQGVWLLEFQERGAPHYHIIMKGKVPKEDLARKWFKIVDSGDQRHLKAGTRIEAIRKPHAAAAYALKYILKNEQKEVPEGYQEVGRFWGKFALPKPEFIEIDQEVDQGARVVRKWSRANKGKRLSRDKGKYSKTFYDAAEPYRKYSYTKPPAGAHENGPLHARRNRAPGGGENTPTEGTECTNSEPKDS